MECVRCGGKTNISSSVEIDIGRYRRRLCSLCNFRFTTIQKRQSSPEVYVERIERRPGGGRKESLTPSEYHARKREAQRRYYRNQSPEERAERHYRDKLRRCGIKLGQ